MKKLVKLFGIICFFGITNACVQQTHLKTVTFQLDMTAIENVSKVGVRGEFTNNPWQETLYMRDDDTNGIFEIVLEQKTANSSVEFKFVNQNDQFELDGQDNRILHFKYQPETIVYKAIFDDINEVQIERN